MRNAVLEEALRLFRLGFGVHWIRPGSKAPVKANWTSGVRDNWETLEREYREGYGLGVRLGKASKLKAGGYLANVDVDVKSKRASDRKDALDLIEGIYPDVLNAPRVETAFGVRFFVRTRAPTKSVKIKTSEKTCKVVLPSTGVNARQKAALTPGELARGVRVRAAWEVEWMSEGRQVVLPPSVHPDTKTPYRWGVDIDDGSDLPWMPETEFMPVSGTADKARKETDGEKFTPVVVDLIGSDLSERMLSAILSGDGVEDRSAWCFSAAMAMTRGGFSDAEVLSVLTDRETYLGVVAYEHAHTTSRTRAAEWVRRYCLAKAKENVSAAKVFAEEVQVAPVLGDKEAREQTEELTGAVSGGSDNWTRKLERGGKDGSGGIRPTLANTVLVLTNAVGPDLFLRDTFSYRDTYGRDAPWTGGKKGKPLTDDDAVNACYWVAKKWKFDPGVHVMSNAMTVIATRNGYHPVRQELEALAEWDGVPRLDTWLRDNFGARGPDEYLGQVFRKWLVASVTRCYEPGHKFDWMPIFEGLQGTGKSTFGSLLFGENYFTDWIGDLSDKDSALGLQGIRCHEFGELDSLRKAEVDTIKAFVTRKVDKVRPPYGRRVVEAPRQVVFFGTTNKEYYLKDETGNRRFNPVEVGKLDFKALLRDREQLWAEAFFIYQNGLEPTLYLAGEAAGTALQLQQDKLVPNETVFWVEDLRKFHANEAEKPRDERFNFRKFKIVKLFDFGGPFEKRRADTPGLHLAGQAIRIVGGKQILVHGAKYWRIGD